MTTAVSAPDVSTVAVAPWRIASNPASPPARVALLGTGAVGKAVLARLAGWTTTPLGTRLSLVLAANSQLSVHDARGLQPASTQWLAAPGGSQIEGPKTRPSDLDDVGFALRGAATPILIDATASDIVADRHADWLAQGIHVVTACKLARGGALGRWRSIEVARSRGNAHYGDAATVGAGLPILRSIHELRASGDRVHAIAGVLSGSLAWLFNYYDGSRPFSALVRDARAAGYTEPDPREDLSGADVRRKLLILARAAGVLLEHDAVELQSLLPSDLDRGDTCIDEGALELLDEPLRARLLQASRKGEILRFVARLEGGHARVGLESLPPSDPLACGAGPDNRVAIWSDRYCEQPLVIQGPGAGAGVTAAALLDDALRIARAPLFPASGIR